jgi:hypothetical protein
MAPDHAPSFEIRKEVILTLDKIISEWVSQVMLLNDNNYFSDFLPKTQNLKILTLKVIISY